MKAFDQMRRHRLDGHDVGDRDLFALRAGAEGLARDPPGFAAHLVVVADDAIDLSHIGKHGACVCAAQPVTTMRASGRWRFSRRIDCRACATASLVTAQLLMTMVRVEPGALGLRAKSLRIRRR